MPVVQTPTYYFFDVAGSGQYLRYAKIAVTGLPAAAVTNIPHGLTDGRGNPVTPLMVGLEAKSNSNFYENAAADATNIYVGVGAASGTHAVDIYLTY